jgi:hypothetical protein
MITLNLHVANSISKKIICQIRESRSYEVLRPVVEIVEEDAHFGASVGPLLCVLQRLGPRDCLTCSFGFCVLKL